MDKNEILLYLEMIEEISRLPLYNSLEVGFRHNPLTTKEQLDRYAHSCNIINGYVIHMINTIRDKDEI